MKKNFLSKSYEKNFNIIYTYCKTEIIEKFLKGINKIKEISYFSADIITTSTNGVHVSVGCSTPSPV